MLIASQPAWRLVRVVDPAFPAYYRIIWSRHAAEMSDLSEPERQVCWAAMVAVERVLCQHLLPAKINWASFGNVVPHLHWHAIARFAWDAHFPNPVWGPAVRPANADEVERVNLALPGIDRALAVACAAVPSGC
ncbi:MAG: HIT family protein [Pseudomonadota bacterium]